MNLFLIVVFLFAAFVTANTSHSSILTPVWVTGTDENGQTKTTQSLYTQAFSIEFTTAAPVPSGLIAAASGNIGKVRSYTHVTVTNGAAPFTPVPSTFKSCPKTFMVFIAAFCIGISLL